MWLRILQRPAQLQEGWGITGGSVLISKFRKAPALDVLHRGDGSGLPKPARRWVVLFLTSLLAAAQSVEGAGNPRPLSRQALMYTSEQSDINCLVSKS